MDLPVSPKKVVTLSIEPMDPREIVEQLEMMIQASAQIFADPNESETVKSLAKKEINTLAICRRIFLDAINVVAAMESKQEPKN